MANKFAKKQVAYRPRPRYGEKCADCRHFLPPHSCEGVAGTIARDGWCQRFDKKRSAA